MQEGFKIIEANNKHQAFDWGLVLASQNIDTIIDRLPDTGKYALFVSEFDYPRAIEQIELYQKENPATHRVYQIEIAKSLFDGRCLIWALVLILIYAINSEFGIDLHGAGIMHKNAVLLGEWWRIFTAVSLHSDLSHLINNITTGIILLGIAMVYYGAGVCILLCYLAGVLGNLVGLFLHINDYYGLGSSGMVMGALGLLVVSGWFTEESKAPLNIKRVSIGIFLFIWIGTNPNSDVVAHLVGFISGIIIGIPAIKILRKPVLFSVINTISFLIVLVLFTFVWWRALR